MEGKKGRKKDKGGGAAAGNATSNKSNEGAKTKTTIISNNLHVTKPAGEKLTKAEKKAAIRT